MTSTPVPTESDSATEAPDQATTTIADGWVLDPLSEDRLVRALARAGPDVIGIAATEQPLVPGGSARTQAERAAMATLEPTVRSGDSPFAAVHLRAGIEHEPGDTITVRPGQGRVLIDPGATVHDPWRDPGPLSIASPLGRSPFPWRPLVLMVACEPDLDIADWGRLLVNRMMSLDIEGRLAVTDQPDGLNLTRPCLADAGSVAALVPDTIITLDDAARDVVPEWCSDRRTALIELSPDVGVDIELVSWRLGRAQGRLRARIGQRVRPGALAGLASRLSAGPQPGPPPHLSPDRANTSIRTTPRPTDASDLTVAAMTSDMSSAGRSRMDGLLDHLERAGHHVELMILADGARHGLGQAREAAATQADILILRGELVEADLSPLVNARHGRDLPTIVDLTDTQLGAARPDSGGEMDQLPELARCCGRATAPNPLLTVAPADNEVRSFVLPEQLTRARFAELRALRRPSTRAADRVLGWRVPTDLGSSPAVAGALTELLTHDPDLNLRVIGVDRIPDGIPLDLHPRVRCSIDDPGPRSINRWIAQVVTRLEGPWGWFGVDRPVLEAAVLGIPSVLSSTSTVHPAGMQVPELSVPRDDEPESWVRILRPLVGGPSTRARLAFDTAIRADEFASDVVSAAIAKRFTGWANRRPT